MTCQTFLGNYPTFKSTSREHREMPPTSKSTVREHNEIPATPKSTLLQAVQTSTTQDLITYFWFNVPGPGNQKTWFLPPELRNSEIE
eukprot:3082646-Pyramimonas_sp.AAC.1